MLELNLLSLEENVLFCRQPSDDCTQMYITNPDHQRQLLKEMTQIRRDLDTFEVLYHHPYTNQTWKSFFPKAVGKDLGPKLLRHEPLPDDLSEIISVCLTENVPQNAIGLGIEYSVLLEKWPAVFEIIGQNYADYNSDQVRLFLQHLEAEKFREFIDRLKFDIEEFDLTEKKLKKLVWRSRKLKLKSFLW